MQELRMKVNVIRNSYCSLITDHGELAREAEGKGASRLELVGMSLFSGPNELSVNKPHRGDVDSSTTSLHLTDSSLSFLQRLA